MASSPFLSVFFLGFIFIFVWQSRNNLIVSSTYTLYVDEQKLKEDEEERYNSPKLHMSMGVP